MKFMGVAGQARHAAKLAAAGVDALVAQGTDGGGHNSPIGTLALIPQAVDAAGGMPVLGAGGIADGRGIAAAFMLGAEGVWVGTRFLATEEANVPRVPETGAAAVHGPRHDGVEVRHRQTGPGHPRPLGRTVRAGRA